MSPSLLEPVLWSVSRKAEDVHASGDTSSNSCGRVLNDSAARGLRAECLRCMEKDVRSWLWPLHIGDAEDPVVEMGKQTSGAQCEADLCVLSAGCHAVGDGEGLQCRLHAWDGCDLEPQRLGRARTKLGNEGIGRRCPAHLRDDLNALLHGVTDEDLEHVFERHAQADLIQHRAEDLVGDALAVDEDAIAIEDHKVEAAHHSGHVSGEHHRQPLGFLHAAQGR